MLSKTRPNNIRRYSIRILELAGGGGMEARYAIQDSFITPLE